MNAEDRKLVEETWRESIETLGVTKQSIVCMEEPAELIQAVSKMLRGKPGAKANLVEEMADTLICIHLLQLMHGITDEDLEQVVVAKTLRQRDRRGSS